jgi:RNA polymerase sigma-70 factor, ECF subfamily
LGLYSIKMKDGQLIFDQFTKGSKQDFELLFRFYYAPLCLYASRYIFDKDECEELVQELFCQLWDKRSSITINISVKAYLFNSVKNKCLNHIKHQKTKQQYRDETIRKFSEDDVSEFDYPEIELLQKIEESIDALPPRRQEVFRMSREQGLKYHEIAEQLGLSVKTVETHLGLALKALRESLKQYRQHLVHFCVFQVKGKNKVGCQ